MAPETRSRSLTRVETEIIPTCGQCSRRAVEHVIVEVRDGELALDLCRVHLERLVRGARRIGA